MTQLPNASDKIGTIQHTFRRRKESDTGEIIASGDVYVTELDLENGVEYWVNVTTNSNNFDWNEWFQTETIEDGKRITVPKDVRRECGIEPGHTANITLYEMKTDQQNIDQVADQCDSLKDIAIRLRAIANELETKAND